MSTPAQHVTRASAVWILLATLAVLPMTATFVPGMWAWGVNTSRFAPAWVTWTFWLLCLMALIPAVAKQLAAWFAGGTPAARFAPAAGFLAGAALLWLLPDRLMLAGDFLNRLTSFDPDASRFAALYPQALPLDRFMHDTLVRWIMAVTGADPAAAGRARGALEAGLLGAVCVHYARVMGWRGAAWVAGACIPFFSGALVLFGGYNKAFVELTLATAAAMVFALDIVRNGRGFIALGLTLSAAFLLHRLGLALVPLAAVTAWLWTREKRHATPAWKPIAGAAIPLVTLVALAPRLIGIVSGFDAVNFDPETVRSQGGAAEALSGRRLSDLANIVLLMAPLAPLAALVPGSMRGRARREGWLLLAALLPLLAFIPFFHPSFGVFRNYDDYGPTGIALSLAAGWIVARAASGPGRDWIAVPAIALAVASGSLWLVHHTDPERGMQRVEAFVIGPPERPAHERASGWDYLGLRYVDLGRLADASRTFGEAARLAPSPRILRQWAVVEELRGNRLQALTLYRRIAERRADSAPAWLDVARLAHDLRDAGTARHAAAQVLRLDPGNVTARGLLESLPSAPE